MRGSKLREEGFRGFVYVLLRPRTRLHFNSVYDYISHHTLTKALVGTLPDEFRV